MGLRAGFVASVLVLCACPGDPLEADSGTLGDTSTSVGASESLTGPTTTSATGNMSVTIGSDSADGSSGSSGPTTMATTTSDSNTTDTRGTSGSGETGDDATSEGTTSAGTTTDGTSTDDSAGVCMGDEAMLHQDPTTALAVAGLDCDDAPAAGAGVLDAETGPDWWWFYGSDAGTCEPDTAGARVTSGGPLLVCAFVQPGCGVTCSVGMEHMTQLGCCGTDEVELAVSCGEDDSTPVALLFGDGTEQCWPFTFEYEF